MTFGLDTNVHQQRTKMAPAAPAVRVTAPSRLHFGMLSFGQPGVRAFGGVGLMIESPALVLDIRPARAFQVAGPLADRIRAAAEAVARALGNSALPPCQIEVVAAPPQHAGLGSGTQLAMAVAAGLYAHQELAPPSAAELAQIVGRGQRSAIGAYGFAHGGLLLEGGKLPGEALAPLIARVELPDAWRVVLAGADGAAGLSGDCERQAFAQLPPVPPIVTQRLCEIAAERLFPAADASQFDRFAQALCDYGALAGSCFAAVQGGPFNGPAVAALVERLKSFGARGVGQSSWGPTVFAVVDSAASARRLIADLGDASAQMVRPARCGATIEVG
jgi:beta-RFAP synthase